MGQFENRNWAWIQTVLLATDAGRLEDFNKLRLSFMASPTLSTQDQSDTNDLVTHVKGIRILGTGVWQPDTRSGKMDGILVNPAKASH